MNEQKGHAAERLSGVANALRESGNSFRSQDEEAFATYADSAADQVERFSGYLRDQNVNDLVRDVKQLAKRQPELFVAGALAAGFFLGRFFKSSEQQRLPAQYRGGYPGDYAGGYAGQYNRYNAQGANRGYRPDYSQGGSSAYGNQSNYSGQYNDSDESRASGQSGYSSSYDDQRRNNQYGDESYRAQNNTGNFSSSYGASYGTGTATGSTTSSSGTEAQGTQQAETEKQSETSAHYEPQAYAATSTVTNKQTEDSKQDDQNNTRKEK